MNAQLSSQPDLFFCSGETRAVLNLARRTDPDTSHAVGKRAPELERAGQIIATGKERPGDSGRLQRVSRCV